MSLRDFIYLDVERLRSFTAQLLGGVPETQTAERGHDAGGSATAEAGLWKFVRAQGELDYRYHRTATETRSMHHQVYSLFERSLEAEGLLEVIDQRFDYGDWSPNHFVDGSFVKLHGRVRIVDYAQSIGAMEAFPGLIKAFKIIQMGNIKTAADAGRISSEEATLQRRELNEMERDIKAMPVQQFSMVGQTLYAEGTVRIKAQPSGAPPDHIIAGNGQLDSLLDSLGAGGVTESPSAASWVTVGQVSGASTNEDLHPMPTGNGMEDAVEKLNAGFRDLIGAGSGTVFPAHTFAPLAVYREISS